MPRVNKISEIDLDISNEKITLDVPELYYLNRKLPYECIEDSVKAKWDKAKKCLRVSVDVKPKKEEKLDLPFTKVEYDGLDEDDIEDGSGGKEDSNKKNIKKFTGDENSTVEVLDSKHFDEVQENDLIANSGQTLVDNHTEVVNDIMQTQNPYPVSPENPFAGLMDPITLFR